MKAEMLVNPAAGRGRGGRAAAELARLAARRGMPMTVAGSLEALHQAARRAVARGTERLLVAGGDGTWHQVTQTLAGSGCALAPVPVGTGNDLAGELGIPARPLAAAVAAAAEAPLVRIDLLEAAGRWICGVCGAGFDGEAAQYARSVRRLRGPAVYVWAVLVTLARFRPLRAEVDHDSGRFDGEVMLVVAANTRRFGGGMRIAPEADPRDGRLDLVILRRVSRFRLLRIFPSVYRGGHCADPAVVMLRTTRARIRLDRAATLFGDGEAVAPAGPEAVEIEVRPAALAVPWAIPGETPGN
jgi:diacylglycerol kinase (ATP)